MLSRTAHAASGASTRQEQVRRLHEEVRLLSCSLASFPSRLADVLASEPWLAERIGPSGERIMTTDVSAFIQRRYPFGVGSSLSTLSRLLTAAAPFAPAGDVVTATGLLYRLQKEAAR